MCVPVLDWYLSLFTYARLVGFMCLPVLDW